MNLGEFPRPSLRARIYWLTSILSAAQPKVHDETQQNLNGQAPEGLSAAALFHAHLATLLTRGKVSEDMLVAVISGTFSSGNTTIQVFSTPDNSPTSTQNSTTRDGDTVAPLVDSDDSTRKATVIASRKSTVAESNPKDCQGGGSQEARKPRRS
ncbi:hypothetical protein B0H16DRAFT_1514465 [Mycena metata]|uniref:Uncharacterized protein n=1 Tax=Mycena metata TaxID=1033252 RepID=A0AAD7JVW6_9AGAR|nr:hypothetical protein B0H16DRAFT_1514465 [Mycena metata]